MLAKLEGYDKLKQARELRAAWTSSSGIGGVNSDLHACCLNSNPSDRSPREKAIPLLEVESACHFRLRCWFGGCAWWVWLHEISIALSTPREPPLELLPLDLLGKQMKLEATGLFKKALDLRAAMTSNSGSVTELSEAPRSHLNLILVASECYVTQGDLSCRVKILLTYQRY